MSILDRRTFLGASAATMGAAYLASCKTGDGRKVAAPEPEPQDGASRVAFDPAAIDLDETRYPLGVQSGDMTATSALLWTKVEGDAGRLRVWREDPEPGFVKLVHEQAVTLTDGFVKAEVTGLGAGWYSYAFFDEALTTRSRIGRFRTAFAQGDLRPLTIGSMACTNFARAPYTACEMLVEEQPDLLCHMGDFVYADGSVSTEDYRDMYRRTFEDPGYRALLPAAGMYSTWDDHEIGNDFDPEKMAVEAPEQLAAGTDAYYQHLAVPERGPRRLWRKYSWGATADVFVLDCRSERKPSTRGDANGIYMSEEQLEWLMLGLEESTAHFKVILNSVPITKFFGLWNLALADRWEGYGAQRERLLEHIATKVTNRVLFLTGDFHCGYLSRVEPEGPLSNVFEVCTATAARAPNPVAVLYDNGNLTAEESFPPGQFEFGSGITREVTTVVLDPLNDEVRVKAVDARADTRGTVIFDGLIPYV